MTPPDPLLINTVQYLTYQQQEKEAKDRASKVKEELIKLVNSQGYSDDRGNVYVDLPRPVTVGDKTVSTLKVEQRTQLFLSEDKILEWAESKGLRDRVVHMVEEINQEGIYELYAEGKLTEQEYDDLHEKIVTFAFRPMT